MPSGNSRVRVTVDWILDAVLSRSSAQLSYFVTTQVDLPAAERTDLYRHFSATAATKCKTQQPANTGGRFSKTELRRGASGEELEVAVHVGGHERVLRQTVIALMKGAELAKPGTG